MHIEHEATGYDLWNTATDPRDPLRPLAQVARQLLGSAAPSPRTLHRWATKGCNGGRYKLPAIRHGEAMLTTAAGLRWFLEAKRVFDARREVS